MAGFKFSRLMVAFVAVASIVAGNVFCDDDAEESSLGRSKVLKLWQKGMNDKEIMEDIELGKERALQIIQRITDYTPTDKILTPYTLMFHHLDDSYADLPVDMLEELGRLNPGSITLGLALRLGMHLSSKLLSEFHDEKHDSPSDRYFRNRLRDTMTLYVVDALKTPTWIEF
ncbi:uncharacterized protein BXIN_2309 [Babesia sp. Xinjiang]|uniref:uncharacterized protein n=1 Tax=Babesia sp. Xinjiang TaxID=462227 RepID=UPI000A21EA68|nr:uncharacterized protein BXIN_2309 [Babesia sp. Xinjiang]ORM40752.1 hypothetical protein BXIN_2309 [Babesia sp. Xinjiang]